MDSDPQEILVQESTSVRKGNAAVAQRLTKKFLTVIEQIFGNRHYGAFDFRRLIENQGANAIIPCTEAYVKCVVHNKITRFGMPKELCKQTS